MAGGAERAEGVVARVLHALRALHHHLPPLLGPLLHPHHRCAHRTKRVRRAAVYVSVVWEAFHGGGYGILFVKIAFDEVGKENAKNFSISCAG
jgi:hypothetical protein